MVASNATEGAVKERATNSLDVAEGAFEEGTGNSSEMTEGAVDEGARNSLVLSVLIPMMIVGMIGNTFVLIIYKSRMKPSNNRTFIMALGGIDMSVCLIGMPLAVVKYWRPPVDRTPGVCMTYWILNYFMILSSAFILLLIAVDR
jgi:hypothetical protein